MSVELGKLLVGETERDAIHIALAPVQANESLDPGQDIGFVEPGDQQRVGNVQTPIGIVDPFLKRRVMEGEKFWMWLYPNTITSLRHDWVHPAFSLSAEKSGKQSELWLRRFANSIHITYEDLLLKAGDWIESGEYAFGSDRSETARDAFYEVSGEFWGHYESVTGKSVEEADRANFFTCSC